MCPGVCLFSSVVPVGLIKDVIICLYVSCLSADGNWFFHWWELILALMGTDAPTDTNWIFPLWNSIPWTAASSRFPGFTAESSGTPALMCSWDSQLLFRQCSSSCAFCSVLSCSLELLGLHVSLHPELRVLMLLLQEQGMDLLQSCDSAKTTSGQFYVCLLTGFPLRQSWSKT